MGKVNIKFIVMSKTLLVQSKSGPPENGFIVLGKVFHCLSSLPKLQSILCQSYRCFLPNLAGFTLTKNLLKAEVPCIGNGSFQPAKPLSRRGSGIKQVSGYKALLAPQPGPK